MDAKAFDFSGYYLILLGASTSDRIDIVAQILRDCWALHMANTNVLVLNDDETDAAIYTYFPFAPTHCEQVRPVMIAKNINREQQRLDQNYFPLKTQNLHGCPIVASATLYPPFSIKYNEHKILGIDGIVLQKLASKMNFTLIMKPLSPNMDYFNSSKLVSNMVIRI